MKKYLILLLFILIPIIIYILTINNKIYYIALGDSLAYGQNAYNKNSFGYPDYIADALRDKLQFYTKDFSVNNYRTTDLINDINSNKKIKIDNKTLTIKHALVEADIVTLSIGTNELFYKLGLNDFDNIYYNENDLKIYVDEVITDIESLIIIIKKYCKEDIIITSFYNPLFHMKKSYAKSIDPIFKYANIRLKEISKKHNIYYVDINNILINNSDLLPNPVNIYPSDKGYNIISKQIIEILDKHIIKK